MWGSMAEVATFIDEHGETGSGNTCLNKLPDSDYIFGYTVDAPEHNGELARQRDELGPPVRGLVLELPVVLAQPVQRLLKQRRRQLRILIHPCSHNLLME